MIENRVLTTVSLFGAARVAYAFLGSVFNILKPPQRQAWKRSEAKDQAHHVKVQAHQRVVCVSVISVVQGSTVRYFIPYG